MSESQVRNENYLAALPGLRNDLSFRKIAKHIIHLLSRQVAISRSKQAFDMNDVSYTNSVKSIQHQLGFRFFVD